LITLGFLFVLDRSCSGFKKWWEIAVQEEEAAKAAFQWYVS